MSLQGKRAVVTGSTGEIGHSIARTLAQQGCDVVLNGFAAQTAIDDLKQSIQKESGVKVIYHGADLSKPRECRHMVEYAVSELGSVDILINNAGIQHVAAIEELSTEWWDAILAVDLSAAFHLTAAVLPGMKERKYGRIVNIASVHGLVGSKYKSAYVAAKHGLIGLTKVVALEVAGQGITCNAICPGFILSPIVERQIQERMQAGNLSRVEAGKDILREKHPSGQFTRKEDLAALVAFLCSDSCANLTGASIPVDGGWTAQ